MGYEKDRLKDYIQVNERIIKFYEKYPDGSLQSEIVALEAERVVMKAYAYRTPDDGRPGVGYSSLQIPGPTPYTKYSEIENAETSAWGRALAALGFEVKRGVASRDEIENKTEQDDPFADTPKSAAVPPRDAHHADGSRSAKPLASDAQRTVLWAKVKRAHGDKAESWFKNRCMEMTGAPNSKKLTVAQVVALDEMLTDPAEASQDYVETFQTEAEKRANG